MNRSTYGFRSCAAMVGRLGMVAGVGLAALALGERNASACGGCFQPPPPPSQTVSDITDERMLLSVSTAQTTLYDQLRYAGNPAAFAWVLPIRGTVTVALSADVLFDSIDTLTATVINAPNLSCPSLPNRCSSGSGGCGASSNSAFGLAAGDGLGQAPVTVTKQQNVGPYDTVQLHAADSSALTKWLTDNGFTIAPDASPILEAYVSEGFDFLAMKLLPDEGVQAMRPVRVSMPGAAFSLPLRMASIGTGPTVGITIWVVSDGRYEPQNFPFFHIEDSQLVWDFGTESSNYAALRASNETALAGKGWEIESSIDLNEQVIQNVVTSGGVYYGPGLGSAPVADAAEDYLPVTAPDDAGAGEAGVFNAPLETADEVRTDDLNTLFEGLPGPNVRVTRIRSDVAHSAMTTDLLLRASADQTQLSNIRNVTQETGLKCPIYDNCAIVGYGTLAQAQASVAGEGSGGSCVTSPLSRHKPIAQFVGLGSVIALAMLRALRGRRRSSK